MHNASSMDQSEALKARTKKFAVDVIRLVRCFPRTIDGEVVGRQLVKSGCSIAANYRSACRSRSPAEFVGKISIVCEEADESQFWLDITIGADIINTAEAKRLLGECSELTAIATASRNTAKANLAKRQRRMLAVLAMLAIQFWQSWQFWQFWQ